MSAVFEVHVISKNKILLLKTMDILKKNDISYSIENKECIDNWNYDNQKTLNNLSIDDIEVLIQNQRKIFLIEGLINSMYRFGINYSRGEENQYYLDFWITTKGQEQLDSNYITDANIQLYEKLKIQVATYMDRESLELCGIGSEVIMPELSHIEDIVANSKNVCMWIFPNEVPCVILKNYKKEIVNGFFVYSLRI